MAVPEIEGLTELRELGRGGFGVVYRAHQAAFRRDVAVKVIPGGGVDADAIRRFERECRAAGAVSGHPNIVRVHDAGVTGDGDPYLVMDLLPNGTLADRVRREGVLELTAAVGLGVGLSGALETAHRAGIIHRDVKPENVLFSSFGDPQLVDFGIARMQNAFESRTGSVSATLAHAAPEVIAGAEATTRSDLYSLGSVLYFALTGETAFGRSGESSLLPLINRITSDPLPDLRARRVPGAVADVIERAMAKDPAARFGTGAEMGEALRAAATALDLPTMPVPIAAPLPADEAAPAASAPVPVEVTSATQVREREVLPPVVVAPVAASPWTRGRLIALGAAGLALLLALLAAVVLRAPDDGDDKLNAGGVETTTSSTTTTTEATTTSEETTTSITETTTTEPTTTVAPSSSTTRRVTTTTAPTTTTTTARPILIPGAVTDVRSADPVAVDEINTVPQHVRITLTWQPPADNGGSEPTYRIRCTLMQGSTPYTGGGDPAPCRGGAEIGTAPAGATSFQPEVERVEPGPSTWIKWEVIAENVAGQAAPIAARPVMPNFVGLKSWQAFPFGRVVGVAIGGAAPIDCGREQSTICRQNRDPGENVAPGAAVTVTEQR